jgi:hypothetical protein
MFYVVPKGRSIIKNLAAFDDLASAKADALALKEQTGENFDIIQQSHVWTTQTFAEAHMLSHDVPNIARD